MRRAWLAVAIAMGVVPGCSNIPTEPTLVILAGPPVLVGAGDIARCELPGAERTARLLDDIPGTVFTAGDNAYPTGATADFQNCYHPTWGRHLSRTRPVPGNHDYETPGALPYFSYFSGRAGPAGLGYYAYRVGDWQVFGLNSEIDISFLSSQVAWLRAELAAGDTKCTLAIWHEPRFSSGPNGSYAHVRDVWRALYDANADVVVNGHEHMYERFAPQDPEGRSDPARGIRQFVVGTGGAELSSPRARLPNSEIVGSDWGVIKLTLGDDDYRWEFVPVAGASFRDSGSGRCH